MTPDERHREREQYARAVVDAYGRAQGATGRVRSADRDLARYLYDRNIPIQLVEDALLLAAARRGLRRRGAALPPVMSLHYYLPLVQELLLHPLDAAALRNLRKGRAPATDPDPDPTSHRR